MQNQSDFSIPDYMYWNMGHYLGWRILEPHLHALGLIPKIVLPTNLLTDHHNPRLFLKTTRPLRLRCQKFSQNLRGWPQSDSVIFPSLFYSCYQPFDLIGPLTWQWSEYMSEEGKLSSQTVANPKGQYGQRGQLGIESTMSRCKW